MKRIVICLVLIFTFVSTVHADWWIHRIGQKDKCTYIHLAMDNTIDIAVSRSLQGKQAVATMAYQSIKEQS